MMSEKNFIDNFHKEIIKKMVHKTKNTIHHKYWETFNEMIQDDK
jgi:hypothetical protein